MGTSREQPGETPLTFEEALGQLEAVVRVLEDGRIGLDESLVRFEEGVRLLQACRTSLQSAERKIMLLTGLDADGNPIVEPFAGEAATLEEKKESRTRRRSRNAAGGSSIHNDSCESAEHNGGANERDGQRGLF